MAQRGTAYFDNRGQFFKTPEEATVSDLSSLLGRIGEGESLAPGIAYMLLEKRAELEAAFAAHDKMLVEEKESLRSAMESDKVTELAAARSSKLVNSGTD